MTGDRQTKEPDYNQARVSSMTGYVTWQAVSNMTDYRQAK